MNRSEFAVLNAALSSDALAFVHRCCQTLNPDDPFLTNWHIKAILYRLEQVRQGEIKRLIINLPPRYLKSILVSVAFPAFWLGHDPTRRFVCLSYGADLSSDLTGYFRTIVQSSWYRNVFPALKFKRITDSQIQTTKRGFRQTTSVGGTITGKGGHVIIIDDPLKPIDAQSQTLRDHLNAWFSNTLLSRLDNKERGAIIVVMQRVHMNDLSGYLIENSDGWTVLNLAAIAEDDEDIPIGNNRLYHRKAGEPLHADHESLETLERLRKEMGSSVFAAQYQQAPVPPGGAMIQREWFRYYDVLPVRTYGMEVLQSWDCASKEGTQNSYSVCTTWLVVDKKYYYLIDVTRGRYDYPRLRQTAVALAERYKPTRILIEDASAGVALAQELKAARQFRVVLVPVNRDKETRLYIQAAKFEAGHVFLPRSAPFMPDLVAELLAFPQGKHDDQVDSITQALAYEFGGYDTSMEWARHL